MKPLRMCTVCRERHEKPQLIRITKDNCGKIMIDLNGTAPGRGAYICKKPECICKAEKRHSLERALSAQISQPLYEELLLQATGKGGGADES